MAKSDFPLPVKLAGYSVYKMRGTEKTVVRLKGGAYAEKMETDPKLAGSRKQQTQFGASSTCAKSIRDAMFSITHLADFPLHGHLLKLNSAIMQLDPDNKLGRRSLIYSRGLHLFEGLSLNRGVSFDTVVTTTVFFSLDRSLCKGTVQLPALSPELNFRSPWNYPYFRFRVNLGIVRDWVFVESRGYQCLTASNNEYVAGFDTEWSPVKIGYRSQQVELQLDNPVFDEHCHLILSIGIELGTQSRGTIQHVKYAGCGKILAMG